MHLRKKGEIFDLFNCISCDNMSTSEYHKHANELFNYGLKISLTKYESSMGLAYKLYRNIIFMHTNLLLFILQIRFLNYSYSKIKPKLFLLLFEIKNVNLK